MSTIQRQIRDAFAARIRAQLPGVNVFMALRREQADSELPAVNIFSHGDRAEDESEDHAGVHGRIYTIRVEIRVNGRPEEDATDSIAIAIRKAVLPDDPDGTVLGFTSGVLNRITWSSQVWDGEEGDAPLAGSALDFNCYYRWRPE